MNLLIPQSPEAERKPDEIKERVAVLDMGERVANAFAYATGLETRGVDAAPPVQESRVPAEVLNSTVKFDPMNPQAELLGDARQQINTLFGKN